MSGFTEVADRIWVARYPLFDVNVSVVGSDRGAVVIDTSTSDSGAASVIAGLRQLGVRSLTGIVNTHAHFDHTFGNHALRAAFGPVPVYAHEEAARALGRQTAAVESWFRRHPDDQTRDDILSTPIDLPTEVFTSLLSVDLGDRVLELVHPGRGHTAGDCVVRLPDADVVWAGDLVEESGPPTYDEDSWPLEWPETLDVVTQLTTDATTVVPGHGAPVDREFILRQRADVAAVAGRIRELHAVGASVEDAIASDGWPLPDLECAIRRGYAHLSGGRRELPLI